jgi:hypothetical protein
MRGDKLSPKQTAVCVFFAAWLASYFFVKFGLPSPLYCALALLSPLVSPWASLGLFATSLYFLWTLIRHGLGMEAVQVAICMYLIASLGDLVRILFSFGSTCG